MALGAQGQPARDLAQDQRGAQLLLLGYDHPAKADAELRSLRSGPAAAAQSDWLDYLEARLRVQEGALEKAAQWAQRRSTPAALVVLAMVHERQGRDSEALRLAEAAQKDLAPHCEHWSGPREDQLDCDFRLQREALRLQARVQLRRSQNAVARTLMEQALALSRAGQDNDITAHDLADLSDIHYLLDQQELSRQAIVNALKLAADSPRMLARVKSYEALLATRRGDREAQLSSYNEALALARKADAPRIEALLLGNLADYYLHTQKPEQARIHAEAALAVLQRFGEPRALRNARHNLAVALVRLRQFDSARQQLALIDKLPVGGDDSASRGEELRELGEAWAKVGQAKEALALYHAERRLTLDSQQRAREAVMADLRAKYDADAQKANLELRRRERELNQQTLSNQEAARKVTLIGALLVGLCAVIAVLALARMRQAHRRLRANQALLQVLSERDPLTQLANRRHFQSAMAARGDEPLVGGLLMIDIDHFKRINDGHGHGAGDLVIQTVAKRLQAALREGDLLVRWGGEEFLILAPSLRTGHVQVLVDRLLLTVGELPVVLESGESLRVTISIGFACFPLPPGGLNLPWERAINWADLALYAAKHRGRNRGVGIVEAQAEDDQGLARIESDFEGAAAAARIKLAQVIGPLAGA
jgi:diguanylate cyclase (GGDEF)-like protein